MKNGIIEGSSRPTEEELAVINRFTRRPFAADEVYAFSVVLCDNDVDRDFERFPVASLERMAELFVGKTGICDHSHRAADQCARIFSCEVVTDETRKTVYGEPYTYLKARAYMPVTEKNEPLITEIDAGIKKEVSVGCAVASRRCTVCGGDPETCGHRKGRHYRKNGVQKLCAHELCEPTDAYEWSFVAVPAQPRAGVTKHFGEAETGEIVKALNTGAMALSDREAAALARHIEALAAKASAAEEYLGLQKTRVIARLTAGLDDEPAAVLRAAIDRMTPHELFKLCRSVTEAEEDCRPQLAREKKQAAAAQNRDFII